jgi:hypothetical protein
VKTGGPNSQGDQSCFSLMPHFSIPGVSNLFYHYLLVHIRRRFQMFQWIDLRNICVQETWFHSPNLRGFITQNHTPNHGSPPSIPAPGPQVQSLKAPSRRLRSFLQDGLRPTMREVKKDHVSFPSLGVPPNHPFIDGFSTRSHPFRGAPIVGSLHVSFPEAFSKTTPHQCFRLGEDPHRRAQLE